MKKILLMVTCAASLLQVTFVYSQANHATNISTSSTPLAEPLGWLNSSGDANEVDIINQWDGKPINFHTTVGATFSQKMQLTPAGLFGISPNFNSGFTPAAQLDVDGNMNIGISTFSSDNSAYQINYQNVLWHNGDVTSIYAGVDAGATSSPGTSGSFYNTAIGNNALSTNSVLVYNVAVGYGALQADYHMNCHTCATNASDNVAVGFQAFNHTQAYGGCAIGGNAAFNNVYGCTVIAIGEFAAYNNLGDSLGPSYESLTANDNIAIGGQALYQNVSGNSNTALGDQSGYWSVGDSNTFLGAQTGIPSGAALNNATAIGANAIVANSYQMILGDNAVQHVGIGYSGVGILPSGKLLCCQVSQPDSFSSSNQII